MDNWAWLNIWCISAEFAAEIAYTTHLSQYYCKPWQTPFKVTIALLLVFRPHISDSGSFDMDVSGLTLSVSMKLGESYLKN